MSTALGIVRNSAFSLLASLITKSANMLVFILIARYLTVEEVGTYSLALTYSIIFGQAASWGLDQLLVREVAGDRERLVDYIVDFVVIRLFLSLVAYAVLTMTVTSIIHYDPTTAHFLIWVGMTVIFDSASNLCQAVFIAHERLRYITSVSLVMSLFRLGATWMGLQATGGLRLLAGVIISTSLTGMLLNLRILYCRFLKDSVPGSRRGTHISLGGWSSWLGEAFPFLFVTLSYTLDTQLDVIVLSAWKGEETVGFYSAGTGVLFALLFVSRAFREAIFPVMSRLYPSDRIGLRRLYGASARWLLAIALPIAVGGTLIARKLMTALYGEAYRQSGAVLQIIIWAVVFLFLNVPSARLMIVAGDQRSLAWFAVSSLGVNLTLNALLIPSLSYVGAALTRLLSSTLFFLLLYSHTYRHLIQFNLVTILPRPLVSAMAMGMIIWFIRDRLPLVPVLIVGTAVYVVVLWLVGFLSDDERDFLKLLVSKVRRNPAENCLRQLDI